MNEKNVLFIVFGATGDLARKKLLGSIYKLYFNGRIDRFAVIGIGRRPFDAKVLINQSMDFINEVSKSVWQEFTDHFYYFQADFNDKERFKALGEYVADIEQKHGLVGNRMIYLATLPKNFEKICEHLKSNKLDESKGWSRIVYEKPFGDDYKSAKKVNKYVKRLFKEEQTYRIDHYLGKELIDNICILRFTNRVFEPVWNKDHIDHVQIILTEEAGLEKRGGYFDKCGALKDVVQNHVLQILSLIGMEEPKEMSGISLQEEKRKLLKSVAKINPPDSVFAQYNSYLQSEGVKPESKTETSVAFKLQIKNRRWQGVPFYIMAGKNLNKTVAKVFIQFKYPPLVIFKDLSKQPANNLLIDIQPDQGFHYTINSKKTGLREMTRVSMEHSQACKYMSNTPESYEVLLSDVLKSDQLAFVSADEIMQQWKIIDPVSRNKPDIVTYEPKTIPEEFRQLIKQDNRMWFFMEDQDNPS